MRLQSPSGDARADILAFIRWRRTGVTFTELTRFLPALTGPNDLTIADQPSVVVWRGLNGEAVEALQGLVHAGEITLARVNPLYYSLEEHVPDLQVATAIRHYRSKRWLPMTLSLAEAEQGGTENGGSGEADRKRLSA